ncbi:MAG: MBL fold metallo-hydrolase [Anaerolineae bacterium]
MIIEFLGTGGATTTPRPGSSTEASRLARQHKTPPWTRSGPGLFLHGPDILIDTSEDICHQLIASNIDYINTCFYSHWHPDHTAGQRVFETNIRSYNTLPLTMMPPTDVYLPQQVAIDAQQWLGIWDSLMYHRDELKVINVHVLEDRDRPVFDDGNGGQVAMTPFRLHEDYVYGFNVETGGKRLVHVADEMYNWEPADELKNPDLAILPAGLFEFHPVTGERIMQANHPLLKREATFRQTLEIVDKLGATETWITHLEEAFDMTPEILAQVETKLQAEGKNIRFAYDTLKIEL